MKRMTTHRLIQVHNLEDLAASKARQAQLAADKAYSYAMPTQYANWCRAARRWARLAFHCRLRLFNDRQYQRQAG